ncbi:sterol desaturase family protein [Azospirillum sp.]|uniref:sterol desaturase family protein n=1 Tax=Azospirillum sp. TaxID=34012 RepID=UPI003D708E65
MEAAIRLGIFLGLFVIAALLEAAWPKRPLTVAKGRRWAVNLGLVVVDVAVQRLTVGALAVAAAAWAQEQGVGLFNVLDAPGWVGAVAAFLVLDFAVYLQHVLSHRLPLLWRLHRVHHADLDIDVSSGLRFHPVEILLSLAWKAAVVVALGADPWVVVAFEAVLNGSSLFTHANLRLPERLDAALRRLVCTPDMHRVHHSVERAETDTNYGFFLSVWDRLCGTYHAAPPAAGHEAAPLGLPGWRDQLGLAHLLAMPFRGEPARRPALEA